MGKRGPERQVSDQELLRAIALAPAPVATIRDIQSDVDMSRAGINKRLAQLVEEGYVSSRNVGASAKVYWLTDEGRQKVFQA